MRHWHTTLFLLGGLLSGCPAPSAPSSIGATNARKAPGSSRTASPAPPNDRKSATPAPEATPSPVTTATAPLATTATPTPVTTATPRPPALTRFAQLIDYDAVANWVPGEVVEGPTHVNRGPVAADVRDADAQTPGRSQFKLFLDGFPGNIGFATPPGKLPYPVFSGPVSLGYAAGQDRPSDGAGAWTSSHWLGGNLPEASAFDRAKIFTHPSNAMALEGGPGPLLVADVPLPAPLRHRLGEALGLPAGADPAALPWFGQLQDGVYVPTTGMAAGETAYVANATPAGGIYVRGTVEIMRAAVKGDASYLMFQVGYPDAAARRTYIVRVDRAARTLKLTALPAGQTLREALAASGGDAEALAAKPATVATGLSAWGTADETAITMNFVAPAGSTAAFNGIVAVDLGAADPLRDPAQPGRLLPATTTRRPLTGHILALGDPAPTAKPALGGLAATLPADLAAAEVFSTEDPLDPSAGPAATGLTIAAAGSVFIQNHLVVAGLHRAAGKPADLEAFAAGLDAAKIDKATVRDRLAIWADRQVFIGKAAPSTPDRSRVGLLLTTSLIGLEDPARVEALRTGGSFPPDESSVFKYFGSLATEGLMALYNQHEPAGIGTGTGGTVPPIDESDVRATANPIYRALGYADLATPEGNPNAAARGLLIVFGSRIQAKRGIMGSGNLSYDREFRHDARLGELPPPFVP